MSWPRPGFCTIHIPCPWPAAMYTKGAQRDVPYLYEGYKQILANNGGASLRVSVITLSKKWTSFYVLYSGGHKCNSLWGVSLRSGVTQIWRKAPRRNRINVIFRLTHHASRKMISTGGDRSSALRDPSSVLYHCATFTLTNGSLLKLYINIFCQFFRSCVIFRVITRKAKIFQFNVNL